MELELNDNNFEDQIKKSDKPVLVDFYAVWCGPCSVLSPILSKVAEDMKDKIIVGKVNVDESPMVSGKYRIERIPAVFLFKNGEPIANFIGARTDEDIKRWVEDSLK